MPKKPTEKQEAAWRRNWYIRRLRAYFHLCPIYGLAGKSIRELIRLGAESEILREKKKKKELEERDNA